MDVEETNSSVERAAVAAPDVPQLTIRAAATGMLLGGLLALCNIYMGLKIGWSSSMSIVAALLGFAIWQIGRLLGARPFGVLENNINQTAASSAALASSAGLVAPIPALALLTGRTLIWPLLALWVLSVMLVGVVVAIPLRRQMMEDESLAFPLGVATAETLREIHTRGHDALKRVAALLAGGILAGGVLIAKELLKLPKIAPAVSFRLNNPALAEKGVTAATLTNLGLALDPALLMVGVGGLIGLRVAASMFCGALLAWGVLGPVVLDSGWAGAGGAAPNALWFGSMVKWHVWPGVGLMVSSALTGFVIGLPTIVRRWRQTLRKDAGDVGSFVSHDVPVRWFGRALVVVLVASAVLQVLLFDVSWWLALLAVVLSFGLAVVAARVSGETGIAPVGPLGKVTQLLFGLVKPDAATANLMAANVTAGAASQSGDLLQDLKTGWMLGAWPRRQVAAQVCGAVSGALAGSAGYLLLIPDPKGMLLTDRWPAPAAAQWRAVAELFAKGLESMPPGSIEAMGIAAVVGIVLGCLEKLLDEPARRYVPSAAAMGLAFVIPGYYAVSALLGALLVALARRGAPVWSRRYLVVVASGIIVGESLMGVALAIQAVWAR